MNRTAPKINGGDYPGNNESSPVTLSTAPETAPAPAPDCTADRETGVDHFSYRGRDWRIFKRGGRRYYLYFEHQKRRYKHSLGEVEKQAAIATAKIKIDAVLDGHKDTLRASMQHVAIAEVPTIRQIIASYEQIALESSEDTKRRNANCFRLVLRRALGRDQVDDLRADVLTADTAQLYFEAALKLAREQGGDQDEIARSKRTANSIFNQAKCVLQPTAIAAYKRRGLQLPETAWQFGTAYKAEKFKKVTAEYDPPSDQVVRRTLHEWVKLEDRDMFLAVGLMLACGLRKEEVQQVRWGMFTRAQASAMLDSRAVGSVNVKNQSGRFTVPPIDPFWTVLNARIDRANWRGAVDELLIQGNATYTSDWLFRKTGDWLRTLGWTTQKTNHALRALSGSLVAMKFGIWRASVWLRHASVNTTQQFYTHFMGEQVFKPEDIRVRWARARFEDKKSLQVPRLGRRS